MSSCHHVIMSSCHLVIMSSCHHVIMSSCHHVILSPPCQGVPNISGLTGMFPSHYNISGGVARPDLWPLRAEDSLGQMISRAGQPEGEDVKSGSSQYQVSVGGFHKMPSGLQEWEDVNPMIWLYHNPCLTIWYNVSPGLYQHIFWYYFALLQDVCLFPLTILINSSTTLNVTSHQFLEIIPCPLTSLGAGWATFKISRGQEQMEAIWLMPNRQFCVNKTRARTDFG